MKHLQTYRLFESSTILTEEQKGFLDKCTKGSWSLNPKTGKVDVDGNFDCSGLKLKDFKGVRFGRVSGAFYCDSNSLTSLEGAPESVEGNFDFDSNGLTSLEGGPQTVGGNFYCNWNRLTDLKGAPQNVGRSFYCNNNRLTSLEGAPQTVGKSFFCGSNKLTSLKGGPQTVRDDFYCDSNNLTSLKGAPQTVRRNFDCNDNPLTSLEGAPETVGGNFYCDEFIVKKWTLEGKLEILKGGSEAAKSLIATAISPEVIQQRIDENPTGMAVDLKGVWKTLKGIPGYEKLKFPPEHSEEAEMLSDLDDIGL
jgi:hypothetical protein